MISGSACPAHEREAHPVLTGAFTVARAPRWQSSGKEKTGLLWEQPGVDK